MIRLELCAMQIFSDVIFFIIYRLSHNVKARPKRNVQTRSKNPLKSRSVNLEKKEYQEYKTNIAEMEMKRIKKEISKYNKEKLHLLFSPRSVGPLIKNIQAVIITSFYYDSWL